MADGVGVPFHTASRLESDPRRLTVTMAVYREKLSITLTDDKWSQLASELNHLMADRYKETVNLNRVYDLRYGYNVNNDMNEYRMVVKVVAGSSQIATLTSTLMTAIDHDLCKYWDLNIRAVFADEFKDQGKVVQVGGGGGGDPELQAAEHKLSDILGIDPSMSKDEMVTALHNFMQVNVTGTSTEGVPHVVQVGGGKRARTTDNPFEDTIESKTEISDRAVFEQAYTLAVEISMVDELDSVLQMSCYGKERLAKVYDDVVAGRIGQRNDDKVSSVVKSSPKIEVLTLAKRKIMTAINRYQKLMGTDLWRRSCVIPDQFDPAEFRAHIRNAQRLQDAPPSTASSSGAQPTIAAAPPSQPAGDMQG
jgi:hypothetical protein